MHLASGTPTTRLGSGLQHVLMLTVLALAVVAVAPYLLPTYMANSLIRAFLYASVALTVDILWGYTGILTFGQSAFFGIGAYAAGLVFTHLGFSPGYAALALAAGVICAMGVATLVGWLSFYQGASPLYASVITLVLPIVVTQVLYSGGNFTGSSSGLSGYESFDISIEAWFWISGAFLITLSAFAWVFVHSDAGKILIAIRENEQHCEYVGIHVSKVKTLLMVGCAAIAAIAGYAFAGMQMVVAPEYAGFVFGTELLIWVALGGRGTLMGPVIGTLVLDVSTSYLSGSLPFVWKLIIGVAFVVVIVALPQGLMPIIRGTLLRLVGRRANTDPASSVAVLVPATKDASAPLDGAGANALVLRNVRKNYGSLKVLEGIEFTAERGELLSLVGPNGAGKTTLMSCIADGGERSGGSVLIQGNDIERLPPHVCVAFGVGRKFQTANVFETLTVIQALRIARTRHRWPSLWRRAATLELPEPALKVISATGIDQCLHIEARHLSHGQKQALELAMVLSLDPSVLLLDEPTAGLTKPERALVGKILIELAHKHKLCILLVEHDLDFVREISSRVIVLHQGRIVLDGSVNHVVESQLVRTIYSGGALAVASGARHE